jgi:HK97 gp10 family phage protein
VSDGITVDPGATDQVAAALSVAAASLADPSDLLADIAARVGAEATSRAPRKTGAMAGSMSAGRVTIDGLPAVELTWGVRYAAFVNFGTGRMAARPFATDALAAAAADTEALAATWADTILSGV